MEPGDPVRGVRVPGPCGCLRASTGAPSDGTGRDVSGLHARLPARAGGPSRGRGGCGLPSQRDGGGDLTTALPSRFRVGADVHRGAPRRVPGLPAISAGPGCRGGRSRRPSVVAAGRSEPATADRRRAGDPRPRAVRPARRAAPRVRHRAPRGAACPGRGLQDGGDRLGWARQREERHRAVTVGGVGPAGTQCPARDRVSIVHPHAAPGGGQGLDPGEVDVQVLQLVHGGGAKRVGRADPR